MYNFQFFMPTKVLFGAGQLKNLHLERMPGRKALIATSNGTSVKKFGYLEAVERELDAAGVEHVLFDEIRPNPTNCRSGRSTSTRCWAATSPPTRCPSRMKTILPFMSRAISKNVLDMKTHRLFFAGMLTAALLTPNACSDDDTTLANTPAKSLFLPNLDSA